MTLHTFQQTTARYPLFQTRCVVISPHTESVMVEWPGCLQFVLSNLIVCVDNTTVTTSVCCQAALQVRGVKRPAVSVGGNLYSCLPHSQQPRLYSCQLSSTHTSPIFMNSNVHDVTEQMDDTASEDSTCQSSESSRTPVNPEASQRHQLPVEIQASDGASFELPKRRRHKAKLPAEKSAAAAVTKPQTLMDVSKQTQSSEPLFKQPSLVDPNCVPKERVQSDTVSISGSVPETDVDQLLGPRSSPSRTTHSPALNETDSVNQVLGEKFQPTGSSQPLNFGYSKCIHPPFFPKLCRMNYTWETWYKAF